jgi:hypothetical protein
MKVKIDQLQKKAVGLIKDQRLIDVTILARLGPLPARLEQIENQVKDIENELTRIEQLLKGFTKAIQENKPANRLEDEILETVHHTRSDRMKIRIEIDWPLLHESRGKEVICEHMASESLVKFLSRLYEAKGIQILEKLSQFKINRGMLVSKDPFSDYRNDSDPTGKPYQSKPISDSGFHTLTHSATKEKVLDLRRACQFLNFKPGAVKVEEVAKN